MEKFYKNCKLCNSEFKLINSEYQLVQCIKCELVFCRNKFGQQDLVTLYDELYNKPNPRYSQHSIKEFKALIDGNIKIGINRKRIIDENIKKSDSVLEIGSGVGLVGYYLKHKLKVENYTGIEIDNTSVIKALSLDVNSLQGDFKIIENFDTQFDKIMMWEVLEHIQDLKYFMNLAYKVLKPTGKILISVPNFDKRKNYKDQTKIYQSGPPIHLNFFTKKSLNLVFKKHNFIVEHSSTKKLPYFELKIKYIIDCIKYLTGKYHGSTIYFIGSKP